MIRLYTHCYGEYGITRAVDLCVLMVVVGLLASGDSGKALLTYKAVLYMDNDF